MSSNHTKDNECECYPRSYSDTYAQEGYRDARLLRVPRDPIKPTCNWLIDRSVSEIKERNYKSNQPNGICRDTNHKDYITCFQGGRNNQNEP
jgi:hypothetical protein